MMLALWKTVTFLVAAVGVLEGVFGDAHATGLGSDLHRRDHAGDDFVFDAAVEALGVLADDDQVDAFVSGLDAGHGADGADGGVEVELLAQLHVNALEALADGRGDGALEGDLVGLDGGERPLGQDVVVPLVEGGGAGGELDPVDGQTRGVDDAAGGGGDLRADAVAGDHDDRVLLGHSGERSFARSGRLTLYGSARGGEWVRRA